jgi:DNA primase
MNTSSFGYTRAGAVVYLCTWQSLADDARLYGAWLRTYCPLHGSDHQRSLSINAESGWGQCFACGRRVFVRDFDPQLAQILSHRVLRGAPEQRSPALPNWGQRHPDPALPVHFPARIDQRRPAWQREEQHVLYQLLTCNALSLHRRAAEGARAYLSSRRIPLRLAQASGIGYLEPGASRHYGRLLRRWEDRLIFPLHTHGSPLVGFAGRLLWHWQDCVNEDEHKQLLEQRGLKRWTKTSPAGWFWELPQPCTPDPLVVVEGPFDRLAILADGVLSPQTVLSLVGTSLQARRLPVPAPPILLALDSDASGRVASMHLAQQLGATMRARVLSYRSTARDGAGKDWSERYRRAGPVALAGLYQQYEALRHG